MKLKIKITKDVLKRSAMCGVKSDEVIENCAIAVAVREIFPTAKVRLLWIDLPNDEEIKLPRSASEFISYFDRFTPEERLQMPEFDFQVDIPESLIDKINIDDIKKSETLELV